MSVQPEVERAPADNGRADRERIEAEQHLAEAPRPPDGSTAVERSDPPAVVPDTVTVRRRAALHAVVGLGASALSAGYLLRALHSASALAWVEFAVLGAVAAWHLVLLIDARAPLLVADRTGVRVRAGRGWDGLRWANIEAATVDPRHGLHDGSVVIRAAAADRCGDAALTVPLGLTTVASTGDLDAALRRLSLAGRAESMLATSLMLAAEPTSEPAAAAPIDPAGEPPRRPALKLLRALRPASRAEVTHPASGETPMTAGTLALSEPHAAAVPELPEIGHLRRSGPGNVSVLVAATDEPAPASADRAAANPPAQGPEPAPGRETVPVIGPQIRAAREHLAASVDDLAARTRIRPHVIEALEVDDFEPCGGDFYARGHLRAISRVLGVDPEPLVRSYDERYAAAPISPRTVFQADLATGRNAAIRRGGDGPNWGALMATVLVLTLVWAIARLVLGG